MAQSERRAIKSMHDRLIDDCVNRKSAKTICAMNRTSTAPHISIESTSAEVWTTFSLYLLIRSIIIIIDLHNDCIQISIDIWDSVHRKLAHIHVHGERAK